MKELSLRQVDLAEVLEAPLDRIKAMTSGRVQKFRPEEVRALVEKLDLSAHWVATGEGPMRQDPESQDQFVARMRGITQMRAAIDAMPLRPFAKDRLGALMTGDPAQDGALIADAVLKEALGIDFATGKPIDAVEVAAALKPEEAALLDNYRHSDEIGRAAARRLLTPASTSGKKDKAA